MRLFLAIKKGKQGKDYITAVIKSRHYPSTYAVDNRGVQIVELPEIKEGKDISNCHIYL